MYTTGTLLVLQGLAAAAKSGFEAFVGACALASTEHGLYRPQTAVWAAKLLVNPDWPSAYDIVSLTQLSNGTK